MIPRDLDEASESDLRDLIRDGVTESKGREFKAMLDLDGKHKSEHKRHLVREVSGFANEEGGDFIVGVAENEDGEAEKLIGMDLNSIDDTKERWGNILRDNIEPPIPSNLLDMTEVEFQNANGDDHHGIIIRTEASWRAPHRETLTHRFYGRSPSGKQELDMGEIRDRFLETERFTERIKGFRDERIEAIKQNSSVIPIVDGPLLVLHVVPSNSFVRGAVLDPKVADKKRENHPQLLSTRPSGMYTRYNTEGYLMASTLKDNNVASKYVQTFRTGPIEAVTDFGTIDAETTDSDISRIDSKIVREYLEARLPEYTSFLHEQDARYPYVIFLSAVSAAGFYVVSNKQRAGDDEHKVISTNDERFTEVMVGSPSAEIEDVVSNLMDYLYQAAGHEGEPAGQK